MVGKVDLLVEHYNRTSEITTKFWQQRNVTFITIVGVVAMAALLTSRDVIELVAAALSEIFKFQAVEREAMRKALPYSVINIGLMVTVFYLMVNLYHRHASIVRNFVYLGHLEQEIRRDLGVGEKDVAFTRESSFYFANQSIILRMMKAFYTLILGGLLLAYFYLRITSDLESGNLVLLVADAVVAMATLTVFLGYVVLTKPKSARPSA